MPNRILRDGICTSDLINALTAAEEVLFYRLLVCVDDYGRFDGRAVIIKSECFPLKEELTQKQVEKWLDALERVQLIMRYVVGGKPYICVNKFQQRLRATTSKYPEPDGQTPPSASTETAVDSDPLTDDRQPLTDDSSPPPRATRGRARGRSSETETETKSESESEAYTEATTNVVRAPKNGALPDWLSPSDWDRWRKNRGKKLTAQAVPLQIKKLDELRRAGHDPPAMIDLAIENGWATFWPPKARAPPRQQEPTLSERRTANIDRITRKGNGRDIAGTAERVDKPSVHSLPEPIREPDGDDVGIG